MIDPARPTAEATAPLPDLVLYGRPGCHLCDEARTIIEGLLSERAASGRHAPRLLERDITTDPELHRAFLATIPVVELGGRRLELATSAAKLRRLLDEVLDAMDLTLAVAVGAGVISFLSPCVLPLVPAYLGQLTAVAVAGSAAGTTPSRWLAMRHALAFVAGFGSVFTLLGVTATFVASGFAAYLPALRQVGGVLLVFMGLNLAGILRIPVLERTWRPLDAGAAGSMAGTTGTVALAPPGSAGGPSFGDRLGGRLVTARGGWLASFGLGAIFAVGWTPCIGVILGGILMMAADSTQILQGGALLVAYTIGLGVPFLLIAAVYDRAPGLLRPLVRHGRAVSVVGGLLVVAIGVAMIMDWLALLPRYFQFPGV